MKAVAGLALALIAVRPAFAIDCDVRQAKDRAAFAEALVRVQTVSEDAQSGLGDHCDEQHVTAHVLRPFSGPLMRGEPVSFTLTQGACGERLSEEHDFVKPGRDLVVLLGRDAAGALYPIRTESVLTHAVAQKACATDPGRR